MGSVQLARVIATVAPLHQPIAVLVVFRDPRIDVAVADIDVAGRIPGHIGDLAEQAVDGRKRRIGMLKGMSALIGCFGLAAQHHHRAALGRELHHHVRALVGDPDIVLSVDPDRMGEGPGIKILSDLPEVIAVLVEFQKLRSARPISGVSSVVPR